MTEIETLRSQVEEWKQRVAYLDGRGRDGRNFSFASLCDSIDSKWLEEQVTDLVMWHIRRAEAAESSLATLRSAVEQVAQDVRKEADERHARGELRWLNGRFTARGAFEEIADRLRSLIQGQEQA